MSEPFRHNACNFLSCPPVNEAKVQENTSKIFSELVRTNELC
ncbi:hypothetical protein CsSME_00001013 [Camellia sinensis var. sinensis]